MTMTSHTHTIDPAAATAVAVTPSWNRPFAAGRRLGQVDALAGRRAR